MRIALALVLMTTLLSACMTRDKDSATVSSEVLVDVPAGAMTQTGYEYPAMPLDQYNTLQSGSTEISPAETVETSTGV